MVVPNVLAALRGAMSAVGRASVKEAGKNTVVAFGDNVRRFGSRNAAKNFATGFNKAIDGQSGRGIPRSQRAGFNTAQRMVDSAAKSIVGSSEGSGKRSRGRYPSSRSDKFVTRQRGRSRIPNPNYSSAPKVSGPNFSNQNVNIRQPNVSGNVVLKFGHPPKTKHIIRQNIKFSNFKLSQVVYPNNKIVIYWRPR